MGVDNHGSRKRERNRRSGISRRTVLAGSLAAIGGSSRLVDGGTVATFRDDRDTNGDVQIGTLNTAIQDQSGIFNGVQYLMSYQALLESGFDRVDITVTNTATGATSEYEGSEMEGVEPHTADMGPVLDGQTYEFTFECYLDGTSDPVFTETATDTPDGSDPGDNDDLGGSDDPTLEQFTVTDRSTSDYVEYDISYQVSNADDFSGQIQARFENTFFFTYGNRTFTNDSVGGGTITYPDSEEIDKNWTVFDITVEVVKDSGVVVDSGTVTDDPDGNGTSWSA